MTGIRTPWAAAMLCLSLALALIVPGMAMADDIIVFAAASLKNGLDAAVKAFEAKGSGKVSVSYAGTPQLAKQIEAGAPADIFFSADLDWMKRLEDADLIDRASKVTLLTNRLVLIAPKDSAAMAQITAGFDIAALLGDGRLALASTAAVPAGKYAKAALQHLGLWDKVALRLAETDNVRAALGLVARGELPLGIVYASDAAAEPLVTVLDTFPEDSHPPIRYPVALTTASRNPWAAVLLKFLVSPAGSAFFRSQGFGVITPGS